jgi:ATP-dependent Lon protease
VTAAYRDGLLEIEVPKKSTVRSGADRDSGDAVKPPRRARAPSETSSGPGHPMSKVEAKPEPVGTIQEIRVPEELPLLPNENYVLFPMMIAPASIAGENLLQMIDAVVQGDRLFGIVTVRPDRVRPEDGATYGPGDLYPVGTAATVVRMIKTPSGEARLLVQGVRRFRIREFVSTEPYLRARVELLAEPEGEDKQTRALMKSAVRMLSSFVEKSEMPDAIVVGARSIESPGMLADLIASNMNLSVEDQQNLLELGDPNDRLVKVQEILTREIELAALTNRIQSRIKSKMDQRQREALLREQIKALQQELGEGGDAAPVLSDLREQLSRAKLPEDVRRIADRELGRLETMNEASPEYTVARTYLDWILSLPWGVTTRDNQNLKRAKKVLDDDHYDLEKIKDRILEYLAVNKLRKSIKGPILCLVGPPGVGKTSLGRSIARAMNRKFTRFSLGGMRDEAEIRGHRRTYIGAMPGRIIKAMKDCGTMNPVIMLDEVDKLGADFRGDPAAALLEVLDPEQNATFTDHYLDFPFDLSRVMFVATANVLDTIPGPLRDRMDIIQLSGYTLREKMIIARRYLIPRVLENTGLKPADVKFTDAALQTIVEGYTREAGLRNLEQELNSVCRKVARQVAEGQRAPVHADVAHVEKALGPRPFSRGELIGTDIPGVAIGLAWTPVGGEVLHIEASGTPGEGRLTLTGQLGDVMRESVQAALSHLQAAAPALRIAPRAFKTTNIHLHVPAGAIPKDGPSAGVAMLLALASLFLDRPIRSGLAMTGEITLKGRVLPVGGIKEKVLAAHRSGIRTVILPKENERDLIDIPEDIRDELEFHFVDRAEEALKVAFPTKAAKKRKAVAKRPGPRKPAKKKPAAGRKRRPAAKRKAS